MRYICLAHYPIVLLLLALSAAHADTVKYTYDSARRLVKADYGPKGAITYAYDKSGNLVSSAVTRSSAGAVITSVNVAGSPPSAGIAQTGWIEIHGTNLVPMTTPAAGVIWSSAPDFRTGETAHAGRGRQRNGQWEACLRLLLLQRCDQPCLRIDQVNALTPFTTRPAAWQW